MICLLTRAFFSALVFFKYWSVSSGPVYFLGYLRLRRATPQSSWFLTSEYCAKTFVLVSWTLHSTTFWGLSAEDGTTQAAAIFFFSQSSKHICCVCLRTRLDWQILNRMTLAETSPQMSCLSLSGQRLECIRIPPSLNHVVPSCQTHQHSAAGTLNPPPHVLVQI